MNKLLLIIGLTCFLAGCDEETRVEGDMYFKTTFEDILPFSESNLFVKTEGHSGMFCGKVDSTNVYGIPFKVKLSDVLYKPVTKINFSVWCKFLSNNSSGQFVITLMNGTDQIAWKGVGIGEKIKKLNSWEKISGELIIKDEITPETQLIIYVWNTSLQEFYYDDLEVFFEE